MDTLQAAMHLGQTGDYAGAAARCRSLLAADPARTDVLPLLAEMEFAAGDREAAIAAWRRFLLARPVQADARRKLAGALMVVGRVSEALPEWRRALELEPDNVRALNNLGHALLLAGETIQAVEPLLRAIALKPDYAIAHNNLGRARLHLGAIEDAHASFRHALEIQPTFYEALVNAAHAARELGDSSAALSYLERALAVRGRVPELLLERARILLDRGSWSEAHAAFDTILQLSPGLAAAELGRAEALIGLESMAAALDSLTHLAQAATPNSDLLAARARALLGLHRLHEAAHDADRAVDLAPASAPAHASRGLVQLAAGDAASALQSFDTACRLRPALGVAHTGRGFALEELGRVQEATAAHARALQLGYTDALGLLRVGGLMLQLNRFENAHAAFCEAQRLKPEEWRAAAGIAMSLVALRRHEEAVVALQALLRLAPALPNVVGQLFHEQLHCCDWRDYAFTAARIADGVGRGEKIDLPWSFLMHSGDPAQQRRCSHIHAAAVADGISPIARRAPAPEAASRRIRVAYLSADFHEHATSHLAAGLFESHDRSRFETTAVSYGAAADVPMRRRLQRAFDRFLDVAGESDRAIAQIMKELGIDIAVDMKGFTTGGRVEILAYRPAPIQVAFLGYPGTSGCDFIDYIVADPYVIPETERQHYSEHVIWMPNCYQINDSSRPRAPIPDRGSVGLPDQAFVFCSFNLTCKISPAMFDAWMRILRQVDGAVLWLLQGPGAALRNLRAAALERGVDPARLVFAPPLPAAEHWARIGAADVFLDTAPCNAHTTASDALWAGVPLLTLTGNSFAGRVAGSILHAAGLAELCVSSLQDYERVAVKLARDATAFASLRARARAAQGSSLFDTTGYCRALEAAYVELLARARRGEAAGPVDVAELLARGAA